MKISDALLGEFDHEMANTRKTLERVPEAKFDYKPHAKSWAMGGLATHVAHIPGWAVNTLTMSELDIAPPGKGPMQNPVAKSAKELLEIFDKNAAEARKAIAAAENDEWMKPWSLLAGGRKIFTMPKAAVMRSFVMNHLIHHRAQLGVYLRLNDVPVPAIYGPSADEGGM